MSALESALRHTASCLTQLQLPWALVGGLAVSVRTEPRFTRDIDIVVVAATDAASELVVRDLSARGFRPTAIVEQRAVQRLATVRLLPPGSDAVELLVDVLFASSGIEPEICAAAEHLEVLPNLSLPVATIAHLVALKILSRDDRQRPQDAADLRQLLACLNTQGIDTTREACKLICARGFHRDRDLLRELDHARREFGPLNDL